MIEKELMLARGSCLVCCISRRLAYNYVGTL